MFYYIFYEALKFETVTSKKEVKKWVKERLDKGRKFDGVRLVKHPKKIVKDILKEDDESKEIWAIGRQNKDGFMIKDFEPATTVDELYPREKKDLERKRGILPHHQITADRLIEYGAEEISIEKFRPTWEKFRPMAREITVGIIVLMIWWLFFDELRKWLQ
jgi:hypothetical protein